MKAQKYKKIYKKKFYLDANNKLGYTTICTECNCVDFKKTNIYINDFLKKHINILEYQQSLESNQVTICYCNDDNYEYVNDKWIYIGDIEDMDY